MPTAAARDEQPEPQPAWRSVLAARTPTRGGASAARPVTGGFPAGGAGARRPTPLALQFELREPTRRSAGRWGHTTTTTVAATPGSTAGLRVAVRPVIRSKTGRWVTANVGWGTLHYQVNRLNLDERQVRWFGQFSALSRAARGVSFGQDAERIIVDEFASPLLWPLLDDARRLGIALVGAKQDGAVMLAAAARVSLDAASVGPHSGLRLRTAVTFDDRDAPVVAVGTIGDHGLYAVEWEQGSAASPVPNLTLAPSVEPLTAEQLRLLAHPELVVAADDVDEFLRDYYPVLRRSVPITSTDASVSFPEIVPPLLVLTARFEPRHTLHLDWAWEGDGIDAETGQATLEALTALLAERAPSMLAPSPRAPSLHAPSPHAPSLRAPSAGPPLPSTPAAHTLRDLDAATFTEDVLPAIEALPGVRVDVVGDRPDYRELTEVPTLTVTTVESDQRDWFDLGVMVHIEGRTIPFGPLFTALSKGQKRLLLVDNSHLSLNQPVFDRLRELIEEARALAEWETGVRISRYQASLWSDFEDLAEHTEQAHSWREAVGGLLRLTESNAPDSNAPDPSAPGSDVLGSGAPEADAVEPAAVPLPTGLAATLRPYQLEGYRWLAFLWRHALGGILADDMGLGKTLQALALIAHAVEHPDTGPSTDAATGPFLVVAPTSVVSNWVSEAARFTPGLAVTAITTTQAKAGAPLAETWRGADVVVTSYTLFRLDFEAYQAQQWGGLILDEAQFVKNHAARAHRCARELNAPFKLAVTGTPLENNLVELWSLFAIVAPGLFPSSRRFTEQYVRPIDHARSRGDSAAVLSKLRRRIRPLLLRRTKELVAPELPAKQEQVLQVELSPKHRTLYDTFLQRERQKLFGLIDDLDKNRFIVFRSLTLLRMLSLDASLVDEKYAAVPSSKLDALFEQLQDVLAEGHRALIFSQFTSFLQKAASRLDAQGVEYAYLDGSTRRRASVIAQFKNGSAPVFLISLKAGGFGLNLTEADYVFLLDPWWNPASEAQAVDRTHRIGQDKNVMVYRMVATGTIEEKVMALKESKSRLFDAVLDDDAVFSSSLTADDIRGLLEG